MADKEPRRRKKRKDSQSRKEDSRTEDQVFMAPKQDSKDSDHEAEDEVLVSSHQPNVIAKFVFVLLFSCIIASMGFVFISLHGTEKAVDISDNHLDELEVPHDTHDNQLSEDLNHHEEEYHQDIFANINEFLSFGKNAVEEPESVSLVENELDLSKEPELIEKPETLVNDLLEKQETIEDESLSEYVEQNAEQIVNVDATAENNDYSIDESEPVVADVHTLAVTEVTYKAPDPKPHTEDISNHPISSLEENVSSIISSPQEDVDPVFSVITEDIHEMENVLEDPSENENMLSEPQTLTTENDVTSKRDEFDDGIFDEEEKIAYDKFDLTNEADFQIRDQLDHLENILDKDLLDDDDDDIDDEADDYQNDDNQEEFDFWQF